jgi:methionyl aminopeptidase
VLSYAGYHADLNETYPVGKIDDESAKLIRTTRECLDAAIKICKPGALFRDLGKAMYVLLLHHMELYEMNGSLSLSE